ncbi:MAG: serine/threonine protein kinase [Deltaproteobacteria bacterium]|nr:serine/threonine protein kinase [Deltaproteobacteria bacterium]
MGDSGAPAEVKPGDVLAGRYRVERQLGRGGMGVVVAAVHLELDQRVALKFLLPSALDNQEAVQRFLREARASVKLRGEHVARVSDVGTLDSGVPYIVMEYLEGHDLGSELDRRQRLPAAEATEYVLQACVGLAEAHGLGIVHRDLKPANLFLTVRPDGSPLVKVLDFGISKNLSAPGEHQLTSSQTVIGSPSYMSPEQMRGARLADQRSDIWSLGIVLYQLLSGVLPWDGGSFAEICVKIQMSPLPELDPEAEVPAGLRAIVARCLDKAPEARPQSVAALAEALAPFTTPRGRTMVDSIRRIEERAPAPPPSGGGDTRNLRRPMDDSSVLVGQPAGPSTMAALGAATGGRRRLWVGGAVALAVGAVALALLLSRGGGRERAATSTSTSTSTSATATTSSSPPQRAGASALPPGPLVVPLAAAGPGAALVDAGLPVASPAAPGADAATATATATADAANAPDAGVKKRPRKSPTPEDLFRNRN